MLAWQRTLRRWPPLVSAPNATPFVSLYVRGALRGCFGSHEGDRAERLARAFLLALGDTRFGRIGADERSVVAAQLSYLRRIERCSFDEATARIEPGTHGVAVAPPGRPPVLLLPQVARDQRLDTGALLEALARKAQLSMDALREMDLYVVEADELVARPDRPTERVRRRTRPRERTSPIDLAARWIADRIGASGELDVLVDARTGEVAARVGMRLARAATAIQALSAHGGHRDALAKARRWLEREAGALARGGAHGEDIDGPAALAGTLALAALGGARVRDALIARARRCEELPRAPWHAAQVVAALGPDAPAELWRACVLDLDARPWAPWTALAAKARGDEAVLGRTVAALAASVRASAPHAGGVEGTGVPQLALTAICAEAMSHVREARPRADAARAFLRRWQLSPESIGAALEPSVARGAFPASPIAPSILRADVTGHALLALLA